MDARERERLGKEAKALARLAHPNVVAVHELGEDAGALFIVMERVVGGSLRAWLDARPRSVAEVIEMYCQAARGLQAAHDAGLVHRDFKPGNVLVGEDARVRVADFGLARASAPAVASDARRPSDDTRATTSTFAGTPAYMAPEQLVGGIVDARSDQFSFCVSLWEAISGIRPWTPAEVRRAASGSGRLPSPRTLRPIPGLLRSVLLRGLTIESARRWPSMTTLVKSIVWRRRLPRVVAAAAVLLLALGATFVSARRANYLCPDPASTLAEVWNPARRRGLEDNARTKAPAFASVITPTVVASLDDYGSQWILARDSSCAATYQERVQSEEQFDRSMACLQRDLLAFDSAVAVLERATPDVLSHADGVLAQLPSPENCRDTDSLRDGPLPPTQETAASVADVRAMTDRAGLQLGAGDFHAASELAGRAVALARELEYPAVLGEAMVAQGRALFEAGAIEEARRLLFTGSTMTLRARDYRTAAAAMLQLVALEVRERERLSTAHEFLAIAESAIGLAGQPEELVAQHLDHAGLIASAEGRYDDAAMLHADAARRLAAELASDDPRLLQSARWEGNALLGQGRVDEAKVRYEQIELKVVARFGRLHPEYAAIAHNLGLVAQHEGDLAEAKRRFEQALAIVEVAVGPRTRRTAAALTALAQFALDSGDRTQAEKLASRAAEIQLDVLPIGHRERTSALATLGSLALDARELDTALSIHRRLAEEFATGAHKGRSGEVQQVIAWTLCELGRCLDARLPLERARRLSDSGNRALTTYLDLVEARVELAESKQEQGIARLELLLPVAEGMSALEHPELLPEARWQLAHALLRRGFEQDRAREIELLVLATAGYAVVGTRPDALLELANLQARWVELARHSRRKGGRARG